jgi:hypothetical protein
MDRRADRLVDMDLLAATALRGVHRLVDMARREDHRWVDLREEWEARREADGDSPRKATARRWGTHTGHQWAPEWQPRPIFRAR